MAHPVIHWEIGGHDAAALREFYGKTFGWTMTDAGPDYTMVQPDNGGLGGGIMQSREEVPPYVTIYVRVDDLDAKLAEINQAGGRTVVEPMAIGDTMSFAMFADPQGNVVGLLRQSGPPTA